MKSTYWLGAVVCAALAASASSAYYLTPVSRTPILPAPNACGPGYMQVCPDGTAFGPNYNVYPPFAPFGGMLPGPKGQEIQAGQGMGQPYGYYHGGMPPYYGASGRGPGPGQGMHGPGPGAMPGHGPGPGFGQGPGPGGMPGPGPGIGPFTQGRMPGYDLPQGFGFPANVPGPGLPPPGFATGLPAPGYAPGLPSPGYAPAPVFTPAPGYAPQLPAPAYAMPPVSLPSPGYEVPPKAPTPKVFPSHPFARGPRDFFMWSDVMEDRLARTQRPSLVP